MTREAVGDEPRMRLCEFLRSHAQRIVTEWDRRSRTLPAARELSGPALRDHLPEILEVIANRVEAEAHRGESASLEAFPEIHVMDRLARGFELEHVVREYSIFRRVIHDLWHVEVGGDATIDEIKRLDSAIDEAVERSAARFAQVRDRTLRALDRISAEALRHADVDAFLPELMRALMETSAAVDCIVIMLLGDDDLLRVRAAVGLEEELPPDFAVRVGEKFVGRVAAERRLIHVPWALD